MWLWLQNTYFFRMINFLSKYDKNIIPKSVTKMILTTKSTVNRISSQKVPQKRPHFDIFFCMRLLFLRLFLRWDFFWGHFSRWNFLRSYILKKGVFLRCILGRQLFPKLIFSGALPPEKSFFDLKSWTVKKKIFFFDHLTVPVETRFSPCILNGLH